MATRRGSLEKLWTDGRSPGRPDVDLPSRNGKKASNWQPRGREVQSPLAVRTPSGAETEPRG